MGLDALTDQIIYEIVFWITDGGLDLNRIDESSRFRTSNRPAFSFLPNCYKYNNYNDVLNLSSVCRYFRQLLGPGIFSFLSLVRWSEVDSILDYPSRMDRLSNSKDIRRRVLHELIYENWLGSSNEGTRGDDSTLPGVNNAYQLNLSFNNFVTHLEVCNDSLLSGEISKEAFPRLKHLWVLDYPLDRDILKDLPQLESLAINISSLLKCESYMECIPSVSRLDLICDINSLQPSGTLTNFIKKLLHKKPRLRELNFFSSDSEILRYKEFSQLLLIFCSLDLLELFSLRLTNKHIGNSNNAWEILPVDENGPLFIKLLQQCPCLKNLMIDFSFINSLGFPKNYVTPCKSSDRQTSFTLVDSSLSAPKLLFRPREVIGSLIQGIGANRIVFVYGEVIDQAFLHAMGLMSNLLLHLQSSSRTKSAYTEISLVSLEKMWSMGDDSLVRSHYETLMDKWEIEKKMDGGKLWHEIRSSYRDRTFPFNSPRYKKPEHFEVQLQPSDAAVEETVPIMIPQIHGLRLSEFHSVESSLRDLEHYCFKDKALSSIWD